jgi:hypothetical protein
MCPAFWKRDKEDVFFHMLVRTGMLDTDDMSVSCNFNRKRLLTSESGITMRYAPCHNHDATNSSTKQCSRSLFPSKNPQAARHDRYLFSTTLVANGWKIAIKIEEEVWFGLPVACIWVQSRLAKQL